MSTPLTIGIVGTRSRDSAQDLMDVGCALSTFLTQHADQLHNDPLYPFEIVSGGCPEGGDRFAEILNKKYQVPIKIYPAPWRKLHKGAGYARNVRIAQDADVLIACVASGYQPKDEGGTPDTIRKFHAAHPEGKVILV